MTTYKCPFCDFSYVWTIEEQNNKLANEHGNSHENKPIIWSWIDITPLTVSPINDDITPVPLLVEASEPPTESVVIGEVSSPHDED